MTTKDFCIGVSTLSLATVVMAMCGMFAYAILDPTVDDKLVFDVIGPAFQTIVGGFIGLITGIKVGEVKEPKK
jgi:uncharacterized membrane protein YqgA involved in biofilm formation